ncbi:glucose 1-dehydrogenase [Sphingopyxis granuli]|uniref:SDR family NAD(P)-dependent oxidoreductase n=1 Tax=Sphingopyxis granuli TaxID=267128 RepID=UPI001F539E95|nr:glucose 1-dehydrogenase [Sphingopyxis granuli]UNK81058.1 glucose 1-dehydrogenase [Sphingopyxis granuli]
MSGRLDGKSVLISGASRGLGFAQAALFAAEGAKILLTDVLREEGEAAAQSLRDDGYTAEYTYLDVTDADQWRQAVEMAVDKFGGLTTLINNAGIYFAAGLEDELVERWHKIIEVDQTGVFLGMRAAMPALVASGNGAIVNISSVLGVFGMLSAFSYHAVKGAVRTMSRAAAVEYGPKNVRVNTVFPGSVEAPSHAGSNSKDHDTVMSRVPLGRKGRPEDVAYASLYLCSDEAKYVTGAEIFVDGGISAF